MNVPTSLEPFPPSKDQRIFSQPQDVTDPKIRDKFSPKFILVCNLLLTDYCVVCIMSHKMFTKGNNCFFCVRKHFNLSDVSEGSRSRSG